MKKKLFIITTTFLILTPSLIYAQEATSEAEKIQGQLKQRIKETVDENIQNQNTLGSQTTSPRAFIGLIESISESTISITVNPNHQQATVTKQVVVNTDTSLNKVGQSKTEIEDLQIGDYIIAMGSLQNPQTLQAERIVTNSYTAPKYIYQTVYAQVTQLSDQSITLQSPNPKFKQPLSTSSNTELTNTSQQAIEQDSLQINQAATLIVAVPNNSKDDIIIKKLIAFPADPNQNTPPPSTQSGQTNSCGDGVCQDIVCQGLDCPEPETPETCPADCTQD